jgi:hypothetical protein
MAVGQRCLTIECGPGEQRALLWAGGAVYDLNNLIPPGSGWTLFTADAINEAGEIVGTGARAGYASARGYKLTPLATSVPETHAYAVTLSFAPNPSRGAGVLRWQSPAGGPATVDLYDVTGRWIAGRRFDDLPAGVVIVPLDAVAGSAALASGSYLVRVRRADGSTESVRVIVAR